MKILAFFLVGFTTAFARTHPLLHCQCAAFGDKDIDFHSKPLMFGPLQSNITCDFPRAMDKCKRSCNIVVPSIIDQAPDLICEASMPNVHRLKPAIFYKMCNSKQWVYSGFTMEYQICCENSKLVPCVKPTETSTTT